jgi:hypothetical protein
MSCKKEWSFEFVMENIPDKTWFAAYLDEHLWETEQRLLPASQHDAHLLHQIRALREQTQHMPKITTMQKRRIPNDLIDQKRHEKRDIAGRIKALKAQCSLFDTDTTRADKTKEAPAHMTYIMKCPTESCRGYINKSFVCETCGIKLCNRCHIPLPKKATHKCDPNDVLTATEIMQTTRQCPKCFVPIWKISGCNQIFCTACHCMFDWETRKIDNGIIHNPHYFEWLAANPPQQEAPQDIGTIACGAVPPIHVFRTFVTDLCLYAVYRTLNHFEAEVRPHYPLDKVKENHDLRVSYLLNDFDRDTFKTKLYNREKRRMKLRAINDLITLEIDILADIVRTIVYTKSWTAASIMKTYQSLAAFHEESLDNIKRVHGGKVHNSLLICFNV